MITTSTLSATLFITFGNVSSGIFWIFLQMFALSCCPRSRGLGPTFLRKTMAEQLQWTTGQLSSNDSGVLAELRWLARRWGNDIRMRIDLFQRMEAHHTLQGPQKNSFKWLSDLPVWRHWVVSLFTWFHTPDLFLWGYLTNVWKILFMQIPSKEI